MSEIFRSDNLVVRVRAPHGSTRVVVTFAPWRSDPGLERGGFGEDFLDRHGLDAIHVTCAGNDWYQYPEMPQAYAAIRRAAAAYGTLVTYGVSMGGYQAIKAASALKARRVLAISPQYSVDPARVPFETRWPEAHGLAFIDDAIEPWSGGRYAIVFDPRNRLDAAQGRLIEAAIAPVATAQMLLMPFTGHSVLQAWKDADIVSKATLTLLKSKKDTGGVRALFRGRRRSSSAYMQLLADLRALRAG
jgi:pimeloyl-ACP methyl ester carboxylesterase